MNHLELFAGIGGFRKAIDLINKDCLIKFNHIGFSEIDKNAIKTYKANFSTENELELGDIVSFTEDKSNIDNLPKIDLITGGFPCQAFSVMGKQNGFEDERGQLFFRIMDIVKKKKPNYLLLENVKNLLNHDRKRTFKVIESTLKNAGYDIYADIFNTKDFGLPQNRNRVIIFASKEPIDYEFKSFASDVKKHFEQNCSSMSIYIYKNVLDILSKEVPPKYYLSEKIKPTILSDGSAGFKSKSEINQLIARPLTATMHKMHRACQDNYYSKDFIDSNGIVNHVLDFTKDQLCKLPIRKLTPKEAMMLQGFPSDFAFKSQLCGVADGSLYKQAGNAVSVNTIYAVLHYLIEKNIIKENGKSNSKNYKS